MRSLGPRAAVGLALGLTAAGCFGARAVERNYFVLHADPVEAEPDAQTVAGLLRVRDMDTDSVYEKFQIVVRRSPYQLRYSDSNVWAVKPNQMVSDVVARALQGSHAFAGVTRQLLDGRPEFTLAGKLRAIELYDSGDLWFAHLSFHLRLSRFGKTQALWTYEFDERKEIDARSFSHGVRALSEMLHAAVLDAIVEVRGLDFAATAQVDRRERLLRRRTRRLPPEEPMGPFRETPGLIFVPEGQQRRADRTAPLGPSAPQGQPANVLTSTPAETQRQ